MATHPNHFTVAFHIGAHKTATSHLQRSFLKKADALADAGVRYYGPEYFRLPGRTIPRLFQMRAAQNGPTPKRSPADQLALMRKNAHRLIFSEENYIGPLNAPRLKLLHNRYPDAGPRVTALANAIQLDGIDVFLGIRTPTRYINSAFCQLLLGGRRTTVERFKHLNPVTSIDWLDLTTRLQQADKVRSITVWRHEDYPTIFTQICSALAGPDAGACVTPVARRINVGLSVDAVNAIMDLAPRDVTQDKALTFRHDLPVGDTHAAFDCFDAHEHVQGDAQYQKQIDAISALPNVTFLRP